MLKLNKETYFVSNKEQASTRNGSSELPFKVPLDVLLDDPIYFSPH